MSNQSVILIYAVSENGVIGQDNDIPWRLSDDFKRFKRLTLGHPVLMGRLTWESLGGKPLKKRRNIVITRQTDYDAPGAEIASSLEDAIALCAEHQEIFLIGGATLYNEAWQKELVHKVYQTLVHTEVDGDTFLQLLLDERLSLKNIEANQADEKNEYAWTYLDWEA
jgi:dihydrofolate reductase